MKVLIIDNVERADAGFNDPLRECVAKFADVDSVNYKDIPLLNALHEQYEAIILGGSPLHYSNEVIDSRLPYLQWIPELTIPILGICLGHQNISRLFGGQLLIDEEAENGHLPLEVVGADPLHANIRSGDHVRLMHRASVTLPPGFMQLASTRTCRNQAMKHSTKAIYGVQFHPELSEIGEVFLSNFIGLADTSSLPNRNRDLA